METTAKPNRVKVGELVQWHLWFAMLTLSVAPMVVAAVYVDAFTYPERALLAALAAALPVQLALWFTRWRCRAPDLSWWDGMLTITGCMTMGMGGIYSLVAVALAIVATLASFLFACGGLVIGDTKFAPRQFRRMVAFASRNRMYQK